MNIQNRARWKYHYTITDNLGSWDIITDMGGDLEQSLSFDAWGNRRNANTWSGTATDTPLFDRGFTGHEHLYDLGLINMNGRMYDPLMSSFLSPDKYMQDPTTQQGFNRYAYCMYNPLKYVDPSGNRYFGYDEGAYYRMMEEIQQRVFHEWFSVWDLATASVQLTINMACGLFSHGSDTHGNGSGHHGSPGGGKTFLEAFKKLCKTHGIEYEPGKPIPEKLRTDAFLKEFQETFFPNMPMNYITELSINGYPFETDEHGVTQTDYDIFYGKARVNGYSCIYLNPDYVFQCPENLFYTMGHEFVHASQNIALIDCMYNHIVNDMCIEDIKEYNAYSWDESMGFKHLPFEWSTNCDNYKSYKKILDYKSFSWLNNLIHP